MKRIYSLDVLRGVAIMIMVFVDAPPGVAYPIFIHAPWEGLTFADFAFPGFVFAMGVSAAVSTAKREPSIKKILKRVATLFAVGLIFNTIPFIFAWLIRPEFTAANFYSGAIEHMRFFGILQRLALTYALGMLIVRFIRNDLGILIAAFAMLIVSSAGFHLYAPDNPFAEAHNISRTVDYLFGANHIYLPSHDPEGLYGSVVPVRLPGGARAYRHRDDDLGQNRLAWRRRRDIPNRGRSLERVRHRSQKIMDGSLRADNHGRGKLIARRVAVPARQIPKL